MFERRVEVVELSSSRKCAELFSSLDRRQRREVMAQLCFDRIAQKQEYLAERFRDTEDWNETAYFMLLRSLDIGANRFAYEKLARLLPYHYINQVRHNRHSIEALLLGSAGLLPRLSMLCSGDSGVTELCEIYNYDAHKYALSQMQLSEWQLVGLRGDNHPVVRLLQLATVLSKYPHLLDTFLNCRNKRAVEKIFCDVDIPRWAYRFMSYESRSGGFSREKACMLGINVVAQMQIIYSEYTMRGDLDSRGLELLEQLPAENNSYVRRWANMGVVAENALESQALLQLSKGYCTLTHCDKCPFRRFVDVK